MESLVKKQTLLIVDDVVENIDILAEVLRPNYRIKVALTGERALAIAGSDTPPDLILLDIMMPGMNGYEVCRQLKISPLTREIPVIFVTAMDEDANEKMGFELGAVDFISKPVSPPIVRARVKNHLALYDQNRVLAQKVAEKTVLLQKAMEDIRQSALETIHRLTHAAEYRDEDTGEHIQRMSNYAAAVARQLSVNETTVNWLLHAAPMHDVGKIGIPDQILLKPGKLNDQEWEIMKQHTVIGGKILSGSRAGYIRLGKIIALTHHEKWDGSGYPNGLKGRQIPLLGQIVAIADVFDALTTKRPYKEPFSLEKSFAIIREGRGNHFSPDVVDAFFDITEEILSIKERYQEEKTSLLYEIREGLS